MTIMRDALAPGGDPLSTPACGRPTETAPGEGATR